MASRRSNGKPPDPALVVPDALGSEGRAILAAQQLLQLQEQQTRLEQLAIIEDLGDGDIVPGLLVKGETVLLADRRVQIERAQQRLVSAYDDISEELDAAVAKLRERIRPSDERG